MKKIFKIVIFCYLFLTLNYSAYAKSELKIGAILPLSGDHEFQGKVEGYISFPARGKKGFGYDPIFIPKGEKKTFAQIGKLKKNKISHRYDAFVKIKKYFKFS